MRKNGDEQIPSEGEYSKLSKVCSPLSLGSRGEMQKTQEQGSSYRIFRLYNWRGNDPNFPPVYYCFHVRD